MVCSSGEFHIISRGQTFPFFLFYICRDPGRVSGLHGTDIPGFGDSWELVNRTDSSHHSINPQVITQGWNFHLALIIHLLAATTCTMMICYRQVLTKIPTDVYTILIKTQAEKVQPMQLQQSLVSCKIQSHLATCSVHQRVHLG